MARKVNQEEEFVEFVEESQSALPTIEADFVEESETSYGEWYSYLRIPLSELDDGDEYEGKPVLTEVEKVSFDDDERPTIRCRLLLIDDDSEEYLQININLKKDGDIQTNVHSASSLYALIGGLQNLNNPNWSKQFNRITRCDLQQYRDYLDTLESMSVKVVEKKGSNFTYNSFIVTDAQ